MFGLAPFAGAPFSSFLTFSYNNPISGLQATALLNSVNATPITPVAILGVTGTTSLNIGTGTGGVTFPNRWTSVETDQYRST